MSRSTGILVFASLVAALIYLLSLTPYVGDGYDDASYIALARALADGRGFSQIQLPENPPESQYPPGWPLMLSIVWMAVPNFPANAILFKLVSVACALGMAMILYKWMRWQGGGPIAAMLIVLLTLFNPLILGYSISVFSEIAFTAFSILALWSIERYARSPGAIGRDALICSLFAVFVVYIRVFGLTLVIAAIVYLLLSSDRRKGVVFAGLSMLWLGPWLARSVLLQNQGWNYSQQFFLKSMEQPELGTISGIDLLLRVVTNLRAYLLAGLPGAVMPSQVPLTYVNLAEGLRVGAPFPTSDIMLAVLMAGAVLTPILLRRALVDWYVAFYLGLALLWPWEPTRFVVPIIPFLYASLFLELRLFATALKSPRTLQVARGLAIAGIGVYILASAAQDARYAWNIHQTRQPSAEWQARFRLFDWVQQNVPTTSVLAAMNDSQVYLYTNRTVVRDLGSPEALRHYGVDYVVLIPYGGVMVSGDLSRLRFDPIYQANPSAFTRVYADEPASIEVFRVQREVLVK